MTQTAASAPPPPSQKMTYEEFLNRPDDDRLAEWVDGEVVYVTVSTEHNEIGTFLISLLSEFVLLRDLGRVFYEPFQMKTGPDLPGRSPDILFLAKENLSRLKQNYVDGPADLVVEIVSPESATRDRGEKYYEYERGGVREYWLIDPQRKQAEFYQRGDDGYFHTILPDADGIYRSAVLSELWLRVAWLWQTPPSSLLSVLKEWGIV